MELGYRVHLLMRLANLALIGPVLIDMLFLPPQPIFIHTPHVL